MKFLVAFFIFAAVSHAHAFGLDASISERLAGISDEGDGVKLTESGLAKGDRPGSDLAKKLKSVVREAAPYLNKSVLNGGWNESKMSIDGPVCFDAAPKLAMMLRAQGFPAHVAASGHHVFIVLETKDVSLIVDPTIHQYFGQDASPDWAPRIFVGTLSELKALYARDPGVPVMTYDLVYFNPEDPSVRRDTKIVGMRSKLQYLWFNSEQAPLIEYLKTH